MWSRKVTVKESAGVVEAFGETFSYSFLFGKWHEAVFAVRCDTGEVLEFAVDTRKHLRVAMLTVGCRVFVKYSVPQKNMRLHSINIIWPPWVRPGGPRKDRQITP